VLNPLPGSAEQKAGIVAGVHAPAFGEHDEIANSNSFLESDKSSLNDPVRCSPSPAGKSAT